MIKRPSYLSERPQVAGVLSLFIAFVVTLLPGLVRGQAGGSWTPVPDFGYNNIDGLSSRLSQDGEVGIFGCWGGPVFQTVNGGTTWNQTLTGITPNGIAMSSDGSKIFLAVRDFAIHVSTNSGANWSVVSGLPGVWNDVDCSSDGQIAIACRDTGSVYVTTNGGLNSGDWTEQTIPGASNINFVACSSDGTKRFAASSNGFIYTWDSGSGWVQRDSSRQWAGLTSSADGTKLAATVIGGNIYTSTDSGATWTARESVRDWTRIDSSSNGSILITSTSGTGAGLYTSYDSGLTWTVRAASLTPVSPLRWRGTSVSGDGTRMFAPIGGGTAPQALYMSDTTPGPSEAPGGTDKTVNPVGGTYSFTKTDFGFTDADSPANNFTAVKITTLPGGSLTLGGNPVTAGQVIPVTTGPAGETWASTSTPGDYPTSFGLSDGGSTIVMTGWNGGIYRSTDGGATWTNRLGGGFRGAVAITPDGNRVIAVLRPGAVYTSTDSGETFVSQGTNRFYTSVAISNDGMKAIAGTDGDALYLTTDGGITWSAVTDPTPGTGTWTDVASSADGTKLIASKHNGFLYTSTDSGATWTARDAARAWFGVSSSADGTKLAAAVNGGNIYTSTDFGATWTARASIQNWGTINSSSDGNVLIATVGAGNVYTSTDAGLNWTARDSSRNWVASGVSPNGEKMIAGVGGASGGLPAGGAQILLSNGTPPVLPVWTGSSTTSFTFQVQDDGSTANGGVTEDPTPNTMTIEIPNSAPTDITLSSSAINENEGLNGVVGALTATDANSGDTHTFTFVTGTGDTDNGAFNIDGNNLRLTAAANFEAQPSYSIRLRATDSLGATFEKTFTITVTNVNEPPTSISLSAISLPENGGVNAVVGTISAIGDPDAGASHTFSLEPGTGDTDNGAFNIGGGTSLRLTANGDFEIKPTYSIRLRANDGQGGMVEQAFTITLADVNEPPTGLTLSSSSINENNAPNATVGTLTATGDPDASAMHGYSLVAGAGDTDNGSFNILDNALRLTGVADFETNASYSIRLEANDGLGGIYSNSYTITVNNLPEGAADITLTNASLPENNTPPTTVGTLAAIGDPNPGDTHTFTFVNGAGDTDNGSFLLSGSTLRLNVAANFEVKPTYSIRVQADDGTGGLFSKALTVSITNVNEPPTDITLSNASVPENSGANGVIGTVAAAGDPDAGATHVFTLVTGTGSTDNAFFTLTGSTLRIVPNPDFEDKASYSVRIRADDGFGGIFEKSFTITITDVNEAPTDISLTSATVAENAGANAVIGTLSALGDPEVIDMHNFSLVPGTGSTDNGSFNISGNSLRLTASADFETKSSYSIRVRADDTLGGTFDKVFTISVTDANDAPTNITLSNASVPENAGANAPVGTFSAADPDAGSPPHTFSLEAGVGGDDNALFNISSGQLRLTASADFETKASYSIRVRANDTLGGTFDKVFTIAVTDVNEAPTDISLSNATVPENAGVNAVVGTLSAVGDPDAGATHSFALVSGTGSTDNGAFILSGNSLRLSASADFETKASYSIRVEANDGFGGTFARALTITVTDVNESPTDISLSNATVPENGGIDLVVGSLTALGDPDAGATHTFSLVSGIGSADNFSFNIDGSSLRLSDSADFETKSSYSVRVEANDGAGGTFAKAFTVLITNVNEAPTDISLSNASVPENAGANATIGTLAALGDPDSGASHTYSLVAGTGDTDNASFNISDASLRLTASANFEAKASYSVRIRADDGDSGTFEKSFSITITDVNETPSADSVTAVGDEDATGITVTFLGADPDNDDLTYAIVTPPLPGEGTLGPVLDDTVVFTPAANYNGVVVFTYKALDGEFESASATATVTVNAVNDPPTITDIDSLTILEDGNTGELAFTINDVDAGAILTVTASTNNQILVPDEDLVPGGTGANRTLTVTPEPDQNGVAIVTVEVSDGLLTASDTFTLTVTPVNDEPSFTLNPAPILPGANLAEGRLRAWGFNGSGQIGDGSSSSAGTPVQIGSKTDWIEVATGDFYTVAIRKDGTLWAWGANGSGQLGQGTAAPSDVPLQIGEEDDWKSISAGDGHVLALKAGGTLWAWGNNNYGQTGNGSTSPVPAPMQIGTATDWHMVSAGSLHSLALKSDGTLWAWGRNQFSQLGNGLSSTVTAPVQIGSATDWSFVAAGGTHSVALKQDKSLWAWGRGGEGQIGDGTATPRTSPVQIGTDTDWESIVTGYTFTAALKDDGTLWAWGRNGDGQVGDGTRFNRNSPQQIGMDDDWGMLAAGRYHALALKLDGTLWTWGDNEYSQLGNDDSADLLTPTQLGTGVWSKIAGGFGHSVAIEPETSRLTIPANSGPFTLLDFATDILAGPIDEIAQNVTFEVTNDDNSLFVAQPAIDENGTLTLTPGVDEGTMTVTVSARDDGGTANGGDDLSKAKTFSIRITVAPEMDITGNEIEIESGDVTPDPADHTDFEMVPTVGETLTRTFTITNPGTAALNLTGLPIVSLSGSTAFTVATQPSLPVVERLGGMQTFSITFDPTTAEVVTATVSIMSDDEDENPYTFTIRGEGITPEISLTGNSEDIVNGTEGTSLTNHTHFGESPVVGGTVVRTFTIANTGKQDLSLSGSPQVSVSGSADFTVTAQPASSSVAALNGTSTFQITYDPSTRGNHSAVVSIVNNDEDEAPFTFAISGVGTSPEITVYGNGNEIVSGDTIPSASDHTAFGSVVPAMERTFSIANEGNLDLILGNPVISLNGSTSFSIVSAPMGGTIVTPEGTPATFTIAFDPATPGTQTAEVTVASDDEDESSYTFTIRGTGIPEFSVPTFTGINGGSVVNLASIMGPLPPGGVFSGPGVVNGIFDPNVLPAGEYTLTYTIKDAADEDFSINFDVTVELLPARIEVRRPKKFKTTQVGKKSRPQTFTITNTGKATLTGLSLSVSGSGSRDYQIGNPGVTILEGGRSATVSVIFKPRRAGSRKASITVQGAGVAAVKFILTGVGKQRGGPLNPRFQ